MIWLPMGLSISPYASMRPHMRKVLETMGIKLHLGKVLKSIINSMGPYPAKLSFYDNLQLNMVSELWLIGRP